MAIDFPIPLAIQLANGRVLATPRVSDAGVQVLQNNGSNEPAWATASATGLLTLLSEDPANPVDNTVWAVATGVSPAMNVAIKAQINGSTVVIASSTH